MFVKTVVDVLIVAALIAAMYHEDKFIRFERDCRAIRRACKRQGITARDMFRMVKQEARKCQ